MHPTPSIPASSRSPMMGLVAKTCISRHPKPKVEEGEGLSPLGHLSLQEHVMCCVALREVGHSHQDTLKASHPSEGLSWTTWPRDDLRVARRRLESRAAQPEITLADRSVPCG